MPTFITIEFSRSICYDTVQGCLFRDKEVITLDFTGSVWDMQKNLQVNWIFLLEVEKDKKGEHLCVIYVSSRPYKKNLHAKAGMNLYAPSTTTLQN